MNRRSFFKTTTAAGMLARAAAADFPLLETTQKEFAEAIKNGSLTAEGAAITYCERIARLDRDGPGIHSIIELNPDALPIARALDLERKTQGPRGPLHGVPIVIKDNIDTADRMQTTAGSLALIGAPKPQDSWIAARLRDAGAVLLGKTNLSEWANFRSTHSTSGWSARGGQTKHPYALDRNPCGSSSGSAAAITANFAMLAVGTETDGSIVCPSSVCGLVGIKPTLGLISRRGIIPIAHSQDTAGPMARTVRDAAVLLGALTGVDPADPATHDSLSHSFRDYTQFLDPHGLRGARIGVARQYFKMQPAVSKLMEECLVAMRRAGAELIDPVEFSEFEGWRESENEVLLYEFKADLNRYLAARGGHVRSLADCIAFNRAHSRLEMPYFEQELMEQSQEKEPLTGKAYKNALKKNLRLTRKEGIDSLLKKHRLDAITAPTAGPAWTTDWISGDRVDSGCASPPAVAGYPHITLPAGTVFGLPIGISFFAGAWSEPALVRIAYSFEQLRGVRTVPKFHRTLEFNA